jgi:hypothetical protein
LGQPLVAQRRPALAVGNLGPQGLDLLAELGQLLAGMGTGFAQDGGAFRLDGRQASGQPALALPDLVAAGAITYVPFPPALVGKYQSHTEADLSRLRAAGYRAPMLSVDEGVARYVAALIASTGVNP